MSELRVEYDPDGGEPRLLGFVRHYWENRRREGGMPRRQDIRRPTCASICPTSCSPM